MVKKRQKGYNPLYFFCPRGDVIRVEFIRGVARPHKNNSGLEKNGAIGSFSEAKTGAKIKPKSSYIKKLHGKWGPSFPHKSPPE